MISDFFENLNVMKLPRYLIFDLSYLQMGGGKISQQKGNIKISSKIDLSEISRNSEDIYRLKATANHLGGTNSGHYVCYRDISCNSCIEFDDLSEKGKIKRRQLRGNATIILYEKTKWRW